MKKKILIEIRGGNIESIQTDIKDLQIIVCDHDNFTDEQYYSLVNNVDHEVLKTENLHNIINELAIEQHCND